jgi:hypothetical protein
MARSSKAPIPLAHPRQFSTELIARAMEWQNLAAKLEQRAAAWSEDAVRWDHNHDPRASISGCRAQWAAEQSRQLAAWLRLASDHLASLGANDLH